MNYLEKGILEYDGLMHVADTSPIFPIGEGWDIALRTLSNFPFGTKLYELEEICRLKLLINLPQKSWGKDPYNEKNYHCAVWDNELIELKRKGLINGVTEANEWEWRINNFKKITKPYPKSKYPMFYNENNDFIGFYREDSKFINIIENPEKSFILEYFGGEISDEDFFEVAEEYNFRAEKEFALIEDGITINSEGINVLLEISQEFNLNKDLHERVEPLIRIGYYDTVIRENAIYFESLLKDIHKTQKYGDQLIDEHIKKCIENNNGIFNAGLKVYRQELRTINKYIRNEFIHNLKEIDVAQFNAILYRQNTLYEYLLEIISNLITR